MYMCSVRRTFTTYMPDACEGQTRVPDALELELDYCELPCGCCAAN